MRPLIDEARHLEIRRLVGEEATASFSTSSASMPPGSSRGFALGSGEESLRRSRHALTGLAANFGFPRLTELSRTAVATETGRLRDELDTHPRPALPRDRILRLTLGPKQGAPAAARLNEVPK